MNEEQKPIDEKDEKTNPEETLIENNAVEESESEVDEIQELNQKLAEANDKFLRLYAEFDNFKRRTIKEKAEYLQTAGKDVILALLPVMDDMERALKAAETATDVSAVKEGIQLIQNKLTGVMQSKGLKSIESIGKEFNVDEHEAITNIPAPDESLKGKVVDETEKGYTLNGHVIRFAKVIVGE